jgi:16S rRNA U516 pseudouridylate synthase RsuA-like enzyme
VGPAGTGIALVTGSLAQLTNDQAVAAVINSWVNFIIMEGNAAQIRSFHADLRHGTQGI